MIFVQPWLATTLSGSDLGAEKIARADSTDSDISCNCWSYPGNDCVILPRHLVTPGHTATLAGIINIQYTLPSSAVLSMCLCYVHPLMYHPNFDIKGLIINSLKLSQNQNIYFIQDQH